MHSERGYWCTVRGVLVHSEGILGYSKGSTSAQRGEYWPIVRGVLVHSEGSAGAQ